MVEKSNTDPESVAVLPSIDCTKNRLLCGRNMQFADLRVSNSPILQERPMGRQCNGLCLEVEIKTRNCMNIQFECFRYAEFTLQNVMLNTG